MRHCIDLDKDADIQVQDAEAQSRGDDDGNATGSKYLLLGDDDGYTGVGPAFVFMPCWV